MQNKSPILVALDDIYNYLRPILEAKGKDYATTDDVFKNLRLCEPLVNVSTEKGVIIRLADKISRVSNLLEKDAEIKAESVFDTIIDAVGYLAILHALLKVRDSKKVVGRTNDPINIRPRFTLNVDKKKTSMNFELPDGTKGVVYDDGMIEFIQYGDFVAGSVPHVGKNSK